MCGGQSLRMGQDKGLLRQGNLAWVEIAMHKIESLEQVENVFVSINASQADQYQNVIPKPFLITDSIDLHGPLAGLLSVHKQFPDQNLLIMACDMVDIRVHTMKNLILHFSLPNEAVVYANNGEFEPLLGIYSAKGLSKIAGLLASNLLQKHSMKHVLETLQTVALPIPENTTHEFKNYNTAAELK